jgi:hypothetical protein
MKKLLFISLVLTSVFLASCKEKEKSVTEQVEKGLNDATQNVQKQMNRIDDAAKDNVKKFSDQVQKEAEGTAVKAGEALNKVGDQVNSTLNKVVEKESKDSK